MVSTAHTANMAGPGSPPITTDEMVPGGSFKGHGDPNTLNIPARLGQKYVDLDTGKSWNKKSDDGAASGWFLDSLSAPAISGPPIGYPTTETADVVLMSDSLFITGATIPANDTIHQLDALLPSNFTVRNAAVSGHKIEDMVARYTADIHPYAGGYAFLLAGYNDIVNGESASDTFDELVDLVNLFLADGFTITVCTVPLVLRATDLVAGKLAEYNQRIRNTFSDVFDLEMWLTPVWVNYDDGLHWSNAGHAWVAYGLDQKFQRGPDIRWPLSPGRIAPQIWNNVIDPSGNLSAGVIGSVHGSSVNLPSIGFLADGTFIYVFNGRAYLKVDSINGVRPASSGVMALGSAALPFTNGWFSLGLNSKTLSLTPITKAQRNALTAANGMICYQSDNTPGFRFYEAGAWGKYSFTADP